MDKPFRVVLAGCGAISKAWLRAISDIGGIEVVGLVDINEQAAKERQDEFELSNALCSADLEATLTGTKPDAVFDCTIPQAHVDVTLTALNHGCHVLGEKPLADTMGNARRMVKAAQEAGKTYAVIQNRRYQPEIRAFSELLASGKLGALTTLHCDFDIGAHFGGFRDRMEHVLLVDMAIHTFDAARLICGADPVSVYCKEWNPKGSWYDHDASAVAIFEMSNGIVYTYRGCWCAEGLNTKWESDWHAICESGSAKWDGGAGLQAQVVAERGSFFSKMEDVEVTIPEDAKSGSHAGVIREFVECVRTGRSPETVASDNIKSLAMVFASVESAETGAPVVVSI